MYCLLEGICLPLVDRKCPSMMLWVRYVCLVMVPNISRVNLYTHAPEDLSVLPASKSNKIQKNNLHQSVQHTMNRQIVITLHDRHVICEPSSKSDGFKSWRKLILVSLSAGSTCVLDINSSSMNEMTSDNRRTVLLPITFCWQATNRRKLCKNTPISTFNAFTWQ